MVGNGVRVAPGAVRAAHKAVGMRLGRLADKAVRNHRKSKQAVPAASLKEVAGATWLKDAALANRRTDDFPVNRHDDAGGKGGRPAGLAGAEGSLRHLYPDRNRPGLMTP